MLTTGLHRFDVVCLVGVTPRVQITSLPLCRLLDELIHVYVLLLKYLTQIESILTVFAQELLVLVDSFFARLV